MGWCGVLGGTTDRARLTLDEREAELTRHALETRPTQRAERRL
jgi:hypothetical protein